MASQNPKRRLSLTKAQLREQCGDALLALLKSVTKDGRLTPEEVASLAEWIAEHRAYELPSISHLEEIFSRVLEDGVVTEDERLEIQLGIERVLPVTERGIAQEARVAAKLAFDGPRITQADLSEMAESAASEDLPESPRVGWRNDEMTNRQRDYIAALGGSIKANATKGEASDLIETLLGDRPPTLRQQMVLRFWGRVRQSGEGPPEISDWMEAFYKEDSDHKDAWELFKEESNDDGRQGNPERVPFGIGPAYLARIKRLRATTDAHSKSSGTTIAQPKAARRPSIVVASAQSPDASESQSAQTGLHIPSKASSRRALYWAAAALTASALWLLVSHQPRANPHAQSPQTAPPDLPSPKPLAGQSSDKMPVITDENPNQATPSLSITERKIASFRFTGVIGGQRASAMIDGTLYTVGDVIDRELGLLVYEINVDKSAVTFIDLGGKIYQRTLR